jgi:DNA-binding response OmpR family regulator
MNEKILVADDEDAILMGLGDLLASEGFRVVTARNGREAIERYTAERPDMVVLDVMMPGVSGYDVCREIRRRDPLTPVLMLTAKGEEVDKVVGLELGADDYVVKPFGVSELVARVHAALRRARARAEHHANPRGDLSPVRFGEVEVDPRTMRGLREGKGFTVTPRELHLLRLFAAHEGEALDRATILDEVWGIRYEGTTRTLDQHVAKLRQKIERDPAHPRHILTVHGVGYRFAR